MGQKKICMLQHVIVAELGLKHAIKHGYRTIYDGKTLVAEDATPVAASAMLQTKTVVLCSSSYTAILHPLSLTQLNFVSHVKFL